MNRRAFLALPFVVAAARAFRAEPAGFDPAQLFDVHVGGGGTYSNLLTQPVAFTRENVEAAMRDLDRRWAEAMAPRKSPWIRCL